MGGERAPKRNGHLAAERIGAGPAEVVAAARETGQAALALVVHRSAFPEASRSAALPIRTCRGPIWITLDTWPD
jgi:hypothetical protein